MAKPAFDPNQPFDPVTESAVTPPKPAFDPTQRFEPVEETFAGKMMGVATDAVKTAGKTFMAPYDATRELAETPPKELYDRYGNLLPAAGATIGSAFAPGLGTAIGGGVGELTRQATGIAVGDPNMKNFTKPGENFSVRAGLNAAGQTLGAGVSDVNAIRTAIPGAKPFIERGIEATGRALAPVGEGIKRGVAAVSEAFTGVPAREAVQLMEKPGTLVSTVGQVGSAGKAVEKAEAALGSKLPAKLKAQITTNKDGVADDTVTDLLERIETSPQTVTVEDALAGIKSIDRTIPAPTRNNAGVLQKYYELRSKLSDIVSDKESAYAAAKSTYSEAKGASLFRNIFPRTTTGKVSTVKTVLPLFLDWKRASMIPMTSPAVWGAGLATGAGAVKAAGYAISNPTARQALISRFVAKKYGSAEEQ